MVLVLLARQSYALDLTVGIDNQSSCSISFNKAISKSYVPSAPNTIKPHNIEQIHYQLNEKSTDHIILEYFIKCDESIMSGFFGIKTTKLITSINLEKYYGNLDNKAVISIDKLGNFIIKDA